MLIYVHITMILMMDKYMILSLDIPKLSKIRGKGIHSEGKINSNEHYLTFQWQIGVKTYSKIEV